MLNIVSPTTFPKIVLILQFIGSIQCNKEYDFLPALAIATNYKKTKNN